MCIMAMIMADLYIQRFMIYFGVMCIDFLLQAAIKKMKQKIEEKKKLFLFKKISRLIGH